MCNVLGQNSERGRGVVMLVYGRWRALSSRPRHADGLCRNTEAERRIRLDYRRHPGILCCLEVVE